MIRTIALESRCKGSNAPSPCRVKKKIRQGLWRRPVLWVHLNAFDICHFCPRILFQKTWQNSPKQNNNSYTKSVSLQEAELSLVRFYVPLDTKIGNFEDVLPSQSFSSVLKVSVKITWHTVSSAIATTDIAAAAAVSCRQQNHLFIHTWQPTGCTMQLHAITRDRY